MKKTFTILSLFVLLIAVKKLNAQTFRVTSGLIAMTSIDSCSSTNVTVNTFLGCINWTVGTSSYTIAGNVIDVRVNCTSSFICAGAISNPIFNTTLQNIPPGTYTVNGSAYTDNVLSNTQAIGQLIVTNCTVTGFNEVEFSNSIEFYPNPSNGLLHVKNDSESQQNFQLFDISGKEVKSGYLPKANSQVDFTEVEKGIYFIKIGSNENQSIKKIVIQ